MTPRRRIARCLAVALLLVPAQLRRSEADQPWRCPPGEAACIPNPKAYGFYPTRWRKWPSPPGTEEDKPSKPATAKESTKPEDTEELPPKQTESGTTGDESPDLMPSEPSRPGVKPELPPEPKGDLPQPPDLESLLPPSGNDEPRTAPPPPPRTPPTTKPPKDEPKEIPSDEDPFRDDPLPGDEMGAKHHRHAPLAARGNGPMQWRPDPRRQPVSATKAAKLTAVAPSRAELSAHAQALTGSEAAPPPPPPADTRLSGSNAAAKSPIVLADATGARPIIVRPVSLAPNTPNQVAVTRSNPLRPVGSDAVLPSPMGEKEEVVPAGNWSPETAAPAEVVPASAVVPDSAAPPSAAAAPAAVAAPATSPAAPPGAGLNWRPNPLRGGR